MAMRLAALTWGSFKSSLRRVFGDSQLPFAKALSRRLLDVEEANIAAAKAYRPGHYAGRITLFSTREISGYYPVAPAAGWLPHAAGGVDQHAVEGDNDSLFDVPFNRTLVEDLRLCIERASGTDP
jgi:hypothetical protein